MIKIGITGQEGFVGQHLYNTLGLFPDEFERINFNKEFFNNRQQLQDFVAECDVIVHLAALNRHNDQQVIYDTNINLVKKLIEAIENCQNNPHIFFSSSSQEEKNNLYGKSKREGRKLLIDWANRAGGKFTGLVIPNIFGPFGHPYFNSFIATFCHQLTHNEQPKIQTDSSVGLIYVGDLIKIIINEIRKDKGNHLLSISHTDEHNVSTILALLEKYKVQYFMAGIIPTLNNPFEINLFNTFRGYIDQKNHYPVKFNKYTDSRGDFVELVRLNIGGQVSFSTTLPGITRGNHYHTRKIERFAVIKGKALIQLRKIGTNEVMEFYLDGNTPAYVDMPIWHTHNIKNISDEELYTIFWVNEFFNPNDADTYMETV
jgi:UDP-2-acetamido-2,6-beta-L-arabino-hexul-4-ose reductase